MNKRVLILIWWLAECEFEMHISASFRDTWAEPVAAVCVRDDALQWT